MNIFIDANILLAFYGLSRADLGELKNIAKYAKAKRLKLYISDYLKDEVLRNREAVIGQALDKFRSVGKDLTIPNIFHAYKESVALKKIIREYKKIKEALEKEVLEDIRNSSLLADKVIEEYFNSSPISSVTPEVLRAGLDRAQHGKPPGKRGSCGDAVHWEWLLESVPSGKDLMFITNDPDYESGTDPGSLRGYLAEEWKRRKHSSCILYTTLTDFLRKHFPSIKISEDVDKISGKVFLRIPKDLAESDYLRNIMGKPGGFLTITEEMGKNLGALLSSAVAASTSINTGNLGQYLLNKEEPSKKDNE